MSDQDPYRPPESQPDGDPAKTNSLSWKVFFWLTAVLMALAVVSLPYMPNLGLLDYFDMLLSVVATVGLYGFAYYKPLHRPVFWRYFFYVLLVESVLISVVFPLAQMPVYGEQTTFDFLYLASVAYMVALLYANHQYAYRRAFIWDRRD